MVKLFRWLLTITVVALALALVGAGSAYYLASRSIPDYTATVQVRGLNADVEIVRDTYAVPHIFATTDEDVLFGLGYAHAQDRLWQMVRMRATVQGRLAEMFGPELLNTDKFLRALDLYSYAQKAVAYQTPETIAALEAYSAGVNARIQQVAREALGRGAPEFFLFNKQIAPWQPADSIAMVKLLALQMSDMARSEILRARLSLVLGNDRVEDLMPADTGRAVLSAPRYAELFPGAMQGIADPVRLAYSPVPELGFAGASNAWAAAGGRAASGAALLANDPHLSLTAPSIWMLARLEFPDGGVIGGSVPGIPAISVGRNTDLAWGLTYSYIDDQDIVIEQLDPDDPTRYRTEGGYESFQARDVLIPIKGATAAKYRLRTTRRGPVLPTDALSLSTVTPPGHVAVLQWTALRAEDRTIEALLRTMRARTFADVEEDAKLVIAPAMNITVANATDIALIVSGVSPARAANHSTKGRMPSPGWLDKNDWQGDLPFSVNPQVVNPASGIVVNTNNKTTDAAFPRHLSYTWGDTQRIARAQHLLNARQFHTRDSFIEIQTDVVSNAARSLLPLMAKDLWWAGQPAASGTFERQRQQALELIANWNGEMTEHDPEPLIYAAWAAAFQKRVIVDELGTLAAILPNLRVEFLLRVLNDTDGAGVWCDIRNTTRVETCQEISSAALDEALLDLQEEYGSDITRWRWGYAHQALHESSVLGKMPLVGWFANIRQETPGGDHTLQRGQLRSFGARPFTNLHGSGYRAVYDFADPDSSVYIISTGQSGNLFSRHYDDLATIWRRGEYIPMSLDPELARGGAVGITRLVPVSAR